MPRLIEKYFPQLDEEQKKRLDRLIEVFPEWNAQINLISRKDVENLEERHLLHSLGIAKVLRFVPGTEVMDVGTGGGFPGLPLAIIFPEVQFTLVDSIGKKIKAVTQLAETVGIPNVRPLHSRAEEVPGQFDFITGRAVTELPVFFSWVKKKIKPKDRNSLPNGVLYLKGGDIREEVKIFRERAAVFPLGNFFEEPFFETKAVIYIEGGE